MLGNLQLWREGHSAAAEVAALLGYADEVDAVPGFFEPALLEVSTISRSCCAILHLTAKEQKYPNRIRTLSLSSLLLLTPAPGHDSRCAGIPTDTC